MKDISKNDLEKNLKNLVRVNNEKSSIEWFSNLRKDKYFVVAGPCRVENFEQLDRIGNFLKNQKVDFLRAGAFKPMTFPSGRKPLEYEGLKIIKEVCQKHNLQSVSEIMSINQIEKAIEYIDIIQVGARNMQNYDLLKELGQTKKPIILKRHPGGSLRDFAGAAEWICKQDNHKIIMCERGIVAPHTHSSNSRWLLDITSCIAFKELFPHIPFIVDPSHACGLRERVPALSLASKASGADGVIVEVHYDPKNSHSDPDQAIDFKTFKNLNKKLLIK